MIKVRVEQAMNADPRDPTRSAYRCQKLGRETGISRLVFQAIEYRASMAHAPAQAAEVSPRFRSFSLPADTFHHLLAEFALDIHPECGCYGSR
jgi:hypothetical protein